MDYEGGDPNGHEYRDGEVAEHPEMSRGGAGDGREAPFETEPFAHQAQCFDPGNR